MKHPLRAAALAAGALLCFSASQAFAGLEFMEAEDGGSWHASYRILVNFPHRFDRFEITIDHNLPMTFVKNAQTYNRGTTGQDLDNDGFDDGTASNFNNTTAAFLENGGNRDFSTGGNANIPMPDWHQSGPNTFTSATAADVNANTTQDLRFWMHLGTGGLGQPQTRLHGTRFTINVYRGAGLVATGQAYYKEHLDANGNRVVDELSSLTLMPVPAALWTGLPMLGGVILLIRRNNKRRVL